MMIKMVLEVLGHKKKVKHFLTFSLEHADMVNKALGQIYSSFDIAEGNLEAQTWIGKVGMAQLEPAEFNGRPYNRVAYFLTKGQQAALGILVGEAEGAVVEEEDDEEEYFRHYGGSSFECLRH